MRLRVYSKSTQIKQFQKNKVTLFFRVLARKKERAEKERRM